MTTLIYGLVAGIAACVIAALATSVRVLPEVIDISIVLTGSGLGALAFMVYGALHGYHPDRLGRLAIGGTVLGAVGGALFFVIALLTEVL